jgi:branched-chain amino acid aminotransferase
MMEVSSPLLPFAYFNDEIVLREKAVISIASHSLQYGTMCFGGIRGYVQDNQARIVRIFDHHERLMNSAKILGFNYEISFENFQKIIGELIAKNAPASDFYIRPFIFSNDEAIGPCMDGRRYQLAVYLLPLSKYFKREGGLRMMISSHPKFSDWSLSTKAKASGCYLNSALASSEARRCGFDEALMMNEQGQVVEASVANLFAVYRGQVTTPPLGTGPLEGITLRTVMDLLKSDGVSVSFGILDRSMVLTSDELFLTGSAAEVTYIESVNGRSIGRNGSMGPICKRAHDLFHQMLDMKHQRSAEWMSTFRY